MRFFVLAVLLILSACGKSEENKLLERQAEFVEGCTEQVPSYDVCMCVYNHGSVSNELRTLEANQNDQRAVMRYVVAVKEATEVCVKKLGLDPISR